MTWFLAECAVFGVLLLGLVPLRIDGQYSTQSGLVLLGRVWNTSVRLYPSTSKKKREKGKRTIPQWVLYKLLLENGLDALLKAMEYMKLELLRVHIIAGGPDPFQAVSAYTGAGIALEALDCWAFGRAERTDLWTDIDFFRGSTAFYGRICLRAQAFRVMGAIFRFGTGYLRGYSQYRRSAKMEG